MSIIGIYDSGIGGLTTLCALKKVFPKCDFYYLADNKNVPLGTKSREEIVSAVEQGLELLKRKSHLQVVACNTASTVVNPDAYLLCPNLENLPCDKTLLLCTPATSSALGLKEKGYTIADTRCLASQVEEIAQCKFLENQDLTFESLESTLENIVQKALEENPKIDRIYLGCSHYLYFKSTLEKVCHGLKILDGNKSLISEMLTLENINYGSRKTHFDFTLSPCQEKYDWTLEKLMKNPKFYGI